MDGEPIVSSSLNFNAEELKTLALWQELDAFNRQLELTENLPRYTFYDGPPFATGLPHYGHLLAGTIKDVVTRYAATSGHYVERRFGWDTHGLPVEYEIDKKLGINGRGDVLAMGIDKYNAECRSIVMRYSKEWERTVVRMGRWIDFENDYKTLNPSFMESVWWVFKQLWDKGQIYRSFKIMPYSTACNTPLSNFEVTQNYKDVDDPAVVVSFPLTSDPNVSILAWTTTPWTLPANLALCVNPDFDYVKVKDPETNHHYILLEKRLDSVYNLKKVKPEILQKYKGKDLEGLEYVPLFPYYESRRANFKVFRVVCDGYVTDESGTGVVHQAPGFGEDDFRVGMANGVIDSEGKDVPCPIDEKGCYLDEIADFKGQYVKDADKNIIRHLKQAGRLVKQSVLNHPYPFCWRSDTPLVYRAIPSWFVRVASITDQLVKANKETYWVPEFVQEKRFANWLENARDWAISRNRYWGTPIPLWVSDDMEEIVCIGSIEELERLSGVSGINDLHRDKIDHITIPSQQGKGVLRRVDEVLDCWFESGSMPYAQSHYPFENKEAWEKGFPADFIAEGLDQTRGWFYTLLVLSVHLFGKAPFKNVIVNGLVLAADGKKMSKRLKNYPEPTAIVDHYGADALRLYLINSPVVRAETLKFKEEDVKALLAQVFLPWFNSYRFFATQIVVLRKEFGVEFKYDPAAPTSPALMDRWILASCQSLIKFVRKEMEAYRLYTVVPRLLQLIDELTNWYLRFNRRRLKGENGPEDAVAAMNTLFEVLLTLCKTMSPFTPFITETIYQGLRPYLHSASGAAAAMCLDPKAADDRSIHFLSFPEPNERYSDPEIERRVARMRKVIELVRLVRDRKNIPVKTPLREVVVINADEEYLEDVRSLENYISEELNVKSVLVTSDELKYGVKYRADPDAKILGQRLKKDMPPVLKALKELPSDALKEFLTTKKLEVLGHALDENDVKVVRYFDEAEHPTYDGAFDKNALVLVDVTLDQGLIMEGMAREVVNRVQRLRKKAKLVPVDEVEYHYEMIEDKDGQLKGCLDTQVEFLNRLLKQKMVIKEGGLEGREIIIEEEQEVNDSRFLLALVKP